MSNIPYTHPSQHTQRDKIQWSKCIVWSISIEFISSYIQWNWWMKQGTSSSSNSAGLLVCACTRLSNLNGVKQENCIENHYRCQKSILQKYGTMHKWMDHGKECTKFVKESIIIIIIIIIKSVLCANFLHPLIQLN